MHRRVDRPLVWLAVAVVAVVIVATGTRRLTARGRQNVGAVAVSTVLSPMQRGLTGIAGFFSHTWGVFTEIRSLYAENRRLHTRVDQLTEQVNRLNAAGIENQRLREMLGFRQTLQQSSATGIAADVIAVQPTNWFNTVTIDAGSQQGIREKQMVVTARGLVGQVRLVTRDTATVLLITDLNSSVGARVQRTGWTGIIKGKAGPRLELVFLPGEADLKPGDVIVTSGLDAGSSVFRVKDIVIGTVERVRTNENTSMKSATVRPSVDFRRLQEVFVLTG